MGSALGTTAPPPDHGVLYRDIRDFGAIPGNNPAANRRAIQAAIDSLDPSLIPSRTYGAWGVVYIPGNDQPWAIDGPIFLDQNQVKIVGDGPSSRVAMTYPHTDHCFILGVQRKPQGVALSPDHFVDLYGKLDATAAPTAGTRFGFRTKGDAHLAQHGGPLNYAVDFWASTRQITVEFATDFAATPYSDGPYFGLSDMAKLCPWMLHAAGGQFNIDFQTADPTDPTAAGKGRQVNFNPPTGTGIHRIAFQIDLVNAVITAYIDGTQVAIVNYAGADFIPSANLKFAPNQDSAFLIGASGRGSNAVGSQYYVTGASLDRTIYGLRVSQGLRYASEGVGTPQRRLDGGAINDFSTYFQNDAATIALFPFLDPPATAAATRLIGVQSGSCCQNVQTSTLALSASHASNFSSTTNHLFQDLQVLGRAATPYGMAVALGFALHVDFERVTLAGGSHGLGSLVFGANYPIRLNHCHLAGADAGLFTDYAIASADDLTFDTLGRLAMRLSNGTEFVGRSIFVPSGNAEYVVKSSGQVFIDNINIDFEGTNYPSIATFYASTVQGLPIGGQFVLSNLQCGTIAPGTPLIKLHDGPGSGLPQATFRLQDLILYGQDYATIVQTDSPTWTGEVRADLDIECPYVQTIGSGRNVVSRHGHFVGPPRYSSWTKGAHVLDVPWPGDGQFTQWRCASTGTYGTSTPPAWSGLAPLDVSGDALAAYLYDHSYWSVGATTHAGYFTDYAQALVLNRLLTGGAATAPSGIWVGLSMLRGYRYGNTAEPSGGGYARVATTAATWAPSSGGATSNTSTINFPMPTAAWGSIRTLFLADAASGGNVIAEVEIDPLVANAGMVVSFAPGVLALARSPKPRALSPSTCDAINNFWLRGAALAAPSLYVALSTNAADASVAPTEPAGGYSRVPAPATSLSPATTNLGLAYDVQITNPAAIAFPAPTAAWGTIRSVYLMDAATGGNVLAAANLTIPRTIAAGDPPKSFAPGALWVTRA